VVYHQGHRRYNKKYYNSVGHGRASQHIREAKELSKELGGTDEDVKKYFFSLPPRELKKIFDAYEKQYGRSPREYAEEAIHLWKSGKRKMSGLVAERLFNLLPPRMPLEAKYSLVETLWKEYCPKSHKMVLIGADANEQTIVDTIQSHLMQVVVDHKIPDPLERRFQWLSTGDVNVKQQLQNYLLQTEKSLIIRDLRERIPVLYGHLREHGSITQKMSQHIIIGKHKLDLYFSTNNSGVVIKEPESFILSPTSKHYRDWIWYIILISFILFYLIFS
jgi:hypothetical protein